ncbi:CAMSAP CH domain [Parelaphostrongylus tenuis]|uniref:CAMSAP CH domain n=1 Tax=Parelaphostrongylus tenuis TaxID=148309 RepID=A0AAD5RDG8_PARTN|nr:CAMSAP CH domain [Parelaphostrongylus tenuis]
MALLREWGWGSTCTQFDREVTPVRSPTSPIKSHIASILSSPPSTSAESPKVSVRQMKNSVEQVMIRWINTEVAQKINRHVENMDRDWKDGIMFNALVYRWKPEVVDIVKVRESDARTNLENAFDLAQKHLGIKRLLEVDDVLCTKPDKRSIITYVSQFIRAFGESLPVTEGNDIYSDFLQWLSTACSLDFINSEQGIYFRVRREFIEYRCLYNTIMATKFNFTLEELNDIQEKWETLQHNLEAAAVTIEKRLPQPYSSLSDWTAVGQSIINRPLNLPTENPQKCLVILQKMISEHNSGRLGSRPIAAEYVEPLRLRMEALAAEEPLKIATLKILHSQYVLLAYLYDLDYKMELWRGVEDQVMACLENEVKGSQRLVEKVADSID